MKTELFVLPEKMREDFTEAFVLDKDDLRAVRPDLVAEAEAYGIDFDEWYAEAYLWEKLSPDLPRVGFAESLALLRGRGGTVLIMSEAECSRKPCALLRYGREIYGFVAMVDPRELADRVEYEWRETPRLLAEAREELTLPEDLYVFDTSLDWVIVFTHESVPCPDRNGGERYCRAFGF